MKVTHTQKTRFSPLSTRIHSACLPALLMLAGLTTAELRAQSTWNTTFGSWSTDTNWTPAIVPVSDFTTQLIFNATESYTTTNDIGAFIVNRITVNNTGTGTVTINGTLPVNTLTLGGVDPTLDITGTVLFTGLFANDITLGATNTITKTGPGTFIHDSDNRSTATVPVPNSFTGTIIINQGTFINRSDSLPDTNFNPVSIVVNDGGIYQFGRATAGNPNLPNSTYITVNPGGVVNWQEGEDFGGFHLLGGTIDLQQGTTNLNGSTAQNWTHGTLTGTGTNVFAAAGNQSINKTTAGTVLITGFASINNGTNSTNVLNIVEGTVTMAGARNVGTVKVSLGDDGGTTTGTFDYQGPTATRTAGDFDVKAGNGVIRIGRGSAALTLNGAFSGVGNLSKTGPGVLRLANGLNGTGTITAAEGTLRVEPTAASGNFAVAAGAVLAVNSGQGIFGFSTPSINLASGGSTLQFDLDTNAVVTTPLVTIGNSDGFIFNGTPTIKVTNAQAFANGTYPLVDYSGAPITTGLNLLLAGRTLGTLVYDTINTRIDVNITGTDTVKWAGGNGDWDLGTGAGVGGTNNWKLVTAGTATNFIDTDTITFDDTATRFDVNLATTVRPYSVVVNATSNYTFAGSGKLSGETGLIKSGTGTLVLGTDNEYSGDTVVNGGTVQLGNGGTTGSVAGTISLSDGSSLAFNRSDDYVFTNSLNLASTVSIIQNGTGKVTFPNPIATGTNTVNFGGSGNLTLEAQLTGSGIINKNGSGTLTLLANNSFNGTLNVNGGTVDLEDFGDSGDFNARSIVLNNGGTFIFGPNGNTDLPDATLVTINTGGLFRLEQGENYGGFILDGGEFRIVRNGRNVNSTAIAATGGAIVYDLRSGTITTDETSGSSALNQGSSVTPAVLGVLTKTTSGTVTVSGAITFQGTLALQIKQGTIAMGVGNFPRTGAATITMGDALTSGTLQIDGAGFASTVRPFTMEAGGGTFNVADASASLVIDGVVSGPGPLSKSGNGTLVLNAANDYLGNTVVAGGTLEVNNFFGSGTGSGPVVVAGTLAGVGGIITSAGNDVLLNGTFQPGFTGLMQGSDFSISAGAEGSTVFGASSVARFDLWLSTGTDQSTDPAAADLLLVAGAFEITGGAILELTNPNALSFQAGDIFRLFDWSGVGTLTGAWTIDSTDLNLGDLTLDTSNLYTSGTIAITAVPEPGSALLTLLGLTTCLLRRRRTARSPRG